MSLFETATRKAFRFPSNKGDLTTEQVWTLPLTSKTGFDLDTIAKSINAELKSLEEESFVKAASPKRGDLAIKLDILKHIIKVKQDEVSAAEKRAVNAQERARLTELLAKKNDQELEGLSKEELQAKLDALDA